MSTPTTPIPGQGSDPALTGGISAAASAAVLWALTYFGLPVDGTTKLIVSGVIALLAPLGAALFIRLRAWKPDTVAALQADLMALVNAGHTAEPNTAIAREPMTPVQAAEAHPGSLGLAGAPDDESSIEIGTEDGNPGRHYRRKGTS